MVVRVAEFLKWQHVLFSFRCYQNPYFQQLSYGAFQSLYGEIHFKSNCEVRHKVNWFPVPIWFWVEFKVLGYVTLNSLKTNYLSAFYVSLRHNAKTPIGRMCKVKFIHVSRRSGTWCSPK